MGCLVDPLRRRLRHRAPPRFWPESVAAPDPRHGIPAVSPELDPANAERRFGFAEAKARREAKLRAESDRHERLGVAGVGSGSSNRATTPAATSAPAAKSGCPCDGGAHDPGARAP